MRALVLVAVLAAGSAGADVLSDWTDIALNAASVAKQAPPLQSRTLAMVHVAMFDTIDAVDARYAPYKVKAIPSVGTSAEAAAAVAAHDVLVALFPAQTASLDASQDISLVRVTESGRPGKQPRPRATGGCRHPRPPGLGRLGCTQYLAADDHLRACTSPPRSPAARAGGK